MASPTTADREGCAVLDLPASVLEASITSVTTGTEAVEMLARDADATLLAAQVMRRADDHGWVVVARGDLGGGVCCHAEAFFDSMADADYAAGALECPAGEVLEWAPGLTPDQYEPGGDPMPVPLAGVQLHGPRFAPPGLEVVVVDTDGLETLSATRDAAVSHIRNLIEELAVRLAPKYPAQDDLPAAMLANVERIHDIPPGGMDVSLIHDATLIDLRLGACADGIEERLGRCGIQRVASEPAELAASRRGPRWSPCRPHAQAGRRFAMSAPPRALCRVAACLRSQVRPACAGAAPRGGNRRREGGHRSCFARCRCNRAGGGYRLARSLCPSACRPS